MSQYFPTIAQVRPPAMPYAVVELSFGPGRTRPCKVKGGQNREYLTDKEIGVLAYVRHLEAENAALRRQLAGAAAGPSATAGTTPETPPTPAAEPAGEPPHLVQLGREPPFASARARLPLIALSRSWSFSPEAANGGRPSSVRAPRTAEQYPRSTRPADHVIDG